MPYKKTKDGSLVNEVTLGDGYPLSNDKQPLKVGGEASIINVSSPTPDGSVDGEVEVKGKLKAKDTVIQGDLKVFSDSDTNPQFRFQSKQGVNCQVDVATAANTRASLKLSNSQGIFELRRDPSTTSLKFTDGTNTPLILDGDNVEFTNLTDGSITIDSFVDEDNMSSNSATKVPTQQSVKAYVDNEVAGLVDSAPAALDTLNELAAALNDDASFSTTITNSLALKAPLAAPAFTGNATFDSTTLAIDSSNNRVGIGTTSPSEMLHLQGTGDVKILLEADTDNATETDNPEIIFSQDGGAVTGIAALTSNNTFWLANTFDDTTGALKLGTRNTARMTIEGDGNVGIGTTSPDVALEINGGAGTDLDPLLRINKDVDGDGSATGILIGAVAAGYSKSGIFFENKGIGNGKGNLYFCNDNTGDTSDATIADARMTITNTGNVGIGTTSPSVKLDVEESSVSALIDIHQSASSTGTDSGIRFQKNSNLKGTVGYNAGTDTVNLNYGAFDNTHLNIDSSGKVGIGTTSPQSALHVEEGDIRIDTAQNGTQALRFSDRNGTEGQLQYNSQYLKLRMLTDAADGTDTKRLTVLGGQDATAVGIGTDDPTTTLDVEGTVSYKSIGLSSSSDAFDVSGATTVTANSASGNIILGGFANGVSGQIIHVIHRSPTNSLRFEHNEATATQRIYTSTSADKTLSGYGGMTLFCDGSNWFEIGN